MSKIGRLRFAHLRRLDAMVRKERPYATTRCGRGPLAEHDVVQLLTPFIPEKNREEFARRHDSDFCVRDSRLAAFEPTSSPIAKAPAPSFPCDPIQDSDREQLGLSQHILNLCHLNKGLVLGDGTTGSGKSTTLCAMIGLRHAFGPITSSRLGSDEFVHENQKCVINQREVGTHTDSFKDALRAALREIPTSCSWGSCAESPRPSRSRSETAETGHLVLGRFHTSTARRP